MTDVRITDLLIIGGGPAGLSAAINGASEGLHVQLMDNGAMLGGQARESSAIENYPGFPDGITGDGLMGRLVRQAHKFETGMLCPSQAVALEVLPDRTLRVTTDDYTETVARAVLLALGLQYRRLPAANIAQFVGRGVYYGLPAGKTEHKGKGKVALVIGGANSAGQAAMHLAQENPQLTVKLVVRRELTDAMSQYLIDRIKAAGNIEVCEGCEVMEVFGDTCMRGVQVRTAAGASEHWPAHGMYVFIGAMPKTLWLRSTGVKLDDHKFVIAPLSGTPRPYMTDVPGVFAAGDVRSGSTKRIATAIGEGAAALQQIHGWLAG